MRTSPEDLKRGARELVLSGLDVKSRLYHFRKYADCFVGKEAVDLMVALGTCDVSSRDEAVQIGNAMIAEGILNHLGMSKQKKTQEVTLFMDGHYFYRFNDIEQVKSMDKDADELSEMDEEMESHVLEAMKLGLDVRTRTHRLKKYDSCFLGSDFVDLCLKKGFVSNIKQAETLGDIMMERGFIRHVLDAHPMRNGNYFYNRRLSDETYTQEAKKITPRVRESVSESFEFRIGMFGILLGFALFHLSFAIVAIPLIIAFTSLHSSIKERKMLLDLYDDSMSEKDDSMWMNAYLNLILPELHSFVGHKTEETLRKKLAEMQFPGGLVQSVELISASFLRGAPQIRNVRHIPTGGTDLVVLINLHFEGLFELWCRVKSPLLGVVRVHARFEKFEGIVKFRLYNRKERPPFFSNYSIELDGPNPIMEYAIEIAGLDASRIPLLEGAFRKRVIERLQKQRFSFALDGTSRKSGSFPRNGILQIRHQSARGSEEMLPSSFGMSIRVGKQEAQVFVENGTSEPSAFMISSIDIEKMSELRLSYHKIKNGKIQRSAKATGKTPLHSILQQSVNQFMTLEVSLSPKRYGNVFIDVLWQPMPEQQLIRHDLIRQAIGAYKYIENHLVNDSEASVYFRDRFLGVATLSLRSAVMANNEDVTECEVSFQGQIKRSSPSRGRKALVWSWQTDFLISSMNDTNVFFTLKNKDRVVAKAKLCLVQVTVEFNGSFNRPLGLDDDAGEIDLSFCLMPTQSLQSSAHVLAFANANNFSNGLLREACTLAKDHSKDSLSDDDDDDSSVTLSTGTSSTF